MPDALAFHELRVARIVRETPDTRSLMLEVPPPLRELFAYRSSHFLTFQVRLGVTSPDGSRPWRRVLDACLAIAMP